MKKLWMVLALWGALAAQLHAQWKPVEGRISTQWSEQVNPDNVLPEYPRPIMERTEWKNLNGLWDYAIIEKGKHTFYFLILDCSESKYAIVSLMSELRLIVVE